MQTPTPRVDPRLPGYLLEPLTGGWSGETFLAVPSPGAGIGDRLVVRFFAAARHAPDAARIQAALLDRVRAVLPVPAVREVHDGDDELPGLLVTELLPGERGDLVLTHLVAEHREGGRRESGPRESGPRESGPRESGHRAEGALRALGRALGRAAGMLAATPMPRTGLFADADLRIEPFDLWLPDWVDAHAPGLIARGWSDGEVAGLRKIAERAAVDLEGAAPCLVHSDLNPKNVLVDSATLQVTGVLDWEFAHAGHPATDLGNLLRFDREPPYVEGVLDGWSEAVGAGGPDRRRAVQLARSADLVALIELAARAGTNPVVRQARAHLRAIARTGDVQATP